MFTKENGHHALKVVGHIATVIIAMAIYQRFIASHIAPKKPHVAAKA